MSPRSEMARRVGASLAKQYAARPTDSTRAALVGTVGHRYGGGLVAARRAFGPGGAPVGGMQTGARGGKYHITAGGTKSYTPLALIKQVKSKPVNPMAILPKPPKEQVEKHRASLEEARSKLSMADHRAVKMFTYGYDDTIRAHQGGEGAESLVKKRRDYLNAKGYEADQRGDSPEEHVRKAQLAGPQLESMFGRVPTAKDMPYTYRGIVADEATARRIMSSSIFSMKGKTSSTSWDPTVARSFVARGQDETNPQATHGIILKMKHKSGVGVEHISSVPVEKEILMSGKAKFKVTGRYHDKNNPNYMILEGEEI